jgi:hypothetical protein
MQGKLVGWWGKRGVRDPHLGGVGKILCGLGRSRGSLGNGS